MTFKRTSQQIGSSFEKYLEGVFKQLQKDYGFHYHAFVDSKSAGGIVASQPADYLFGTHKEIGYIEAKASVTHEHLQMSMLRPAQKGAIKRYGQLLGRTYLIVFFSEKTGEVSIYSGPEVMRGARINRRKSLLRISSKKDITIMLAQELDLIPLKSCLDKMNKEWL